MKPKTRKILYEICCVIVGCTMIAALVGGLGIIVYAAFINGGAYFVSLIILLVFLVAMAGIMILKE